MSHGMEVEQHINNQWLLGFSHFVRMKEDERRVFKWGFAELGEEGYSIFVRSTQLGKSCLPA